MKYVPTAIALSLVSACVPAKPLVRQGEMPLRKPEIPQIAPIPPPERPAPPPSGPSAATRFISREISGITFEGVSFDSRSARLAVVDQAGGPGSQYPDAAGAGQAAGAIAAVNAGFFTPEGSPLGLVVADGKVSGNWNSASSLGSGVWYLAPSGTSAITRREKLGNAAARRMRELVQAGPLLVENGQPISGLDATKTSARIAILWNGGSQWWIGRASPCTLAAFANALATGNPAGWPTVRALNLDGGRSSDLWISAQIPGGPITRRTPWNRPVRNFLILKKL